MILFAKNNNSYNNIDDRENNSIFPLQARKWSRMTPTKTLLATATRLPNKREKCAKIARKNVPSNNINVQYQQDIVCKKIFRANAKLSFRGHPGSGKKVGNSREK
jgi:hypothetical protein